MLKLKKSLQALNMKSFIVQKYRWWKCFNKPIYSELAFVWLKSTCTPSRNTNSTSLLNLLISKLAKHIYGISSGASWSVYNVYIILNLVIVTWWHSAVSYYSISLFFRQHHVAIETICTNVHKDNIKFSELVFVYLSEYCLSQSDQSYWIPGRIQWWI